MLAHLYPSIGSAKKNLHLEKKYGLVVHIFNLNLKRQEQMWFESLMVYILSSYVWPHYDTLSKKQKCIKGKVKQTII